jgi:ATP-binding cassette, subfamily B, bacterial
MSSTREWMRFVWQFIRQQRWRFAVILIITLIGPFDQLIWPYILKVGVDVLARYEENRLAAWAALTGPIIGWLSLIFAVELLYRTMGFLQARAIPQLEADLRMAMFDHVQHHSPKYFTEKFAGSLANKITDMTTQVSLILQQLNFPTIPAFVVCLGGIVFLWFVNPLFAWIMLAWAAIHLGMCLGFVRRCDVYEQRHGEARSTLLGKIVDSFTNNFTVNLFYRFRQERDYIGHFQQVEQQENYHAKFFVEILRSFLSFFYLIGAGVALNGCMLYLWVHGKISTGQVVQVFTTVWNIVMNLWNVNTSLPMLFQSFGIAKQAYSVMRDPRDLQDVPNATPLITSSGEIVFDDVSFHYGEKKLFENKHVQIRGGEKVGLVGYTGAGKSTFVNLILRFFPLEKGRILIDGQDISHVSLESLRHSIALIPQEPLLFHRTLRENIHFGRPEASEEELVHAARLAHCDEFIRNLPKGYETTVGERGTKLSGGERQRIAIARAVLADAPILILDEATSALDSVTEKYIQDSLATIMQTRTAIVIAHRLSTLSRMDRILVFDQGKIVEEGTHDALIKKEGLYARMWKMQAGGFLPLVPTEKS